jgi:hypothetical protein
MPDAHRLLDSWQRPAQPRQCYDLLLLFFAQDVAHNVEGISSRGNQRPERDLPLAGFQVIIYGRSWVFTEGLTPLLLRDKKLGCPFNADVLEGT